MSGQLQQAFIYSVIPSAVAVIVAFLATIWHAKPMVRSAVLHFAAGVVIAVVATDLLPDISKQAPLWWIIAGFAGGVVLMLIVHWLTEGEAESAEEEKGAKAKAKQAEGGGWPWGLITGDVVDQVVSGLLLGIGIAAGEHLGLLLSFAMTIEDVTFGLAIAALLTAVGAGRLPILGITAALGAEFVAIAVITTVVVPQHSAILKTIVLAFGAAALLFVVTEQLLVEAHEQRQATLLSAPFFAGFLLLLVLGRMTAA